MGIIYKNGIPYGNQPSTDAVAMIEPSEEASATSAHAYAVGEHFIYNDTLYRATAAIAIGDTITPGTNCVATNVMTEVESGGGGGGSEKLNSTQAADAYDPTATYAVGDKVSYAGDVYSCISAISTPEAWDSTHWDQVDPIQDQVDEARNTLNQLDQNLAYVESGNTASKIYKAGDFISWKGTLYKANQQIQSGASFSTGSGGNLDIVAGVGGGLNNFIDSGNGYCKMPDGTLIQWGLITISAGTYYNDVQYTFPFYDTNYTATATTAGDNLACSVAASKSTYSLRVARSPNTNATDANWIAIGRWK